MSTSSNEHKLNCTDTDVEAGLQAAEDLKTEGSNHFRAQRWSEALVSYQSALGYIPKRRERQRTNFRSSSPQIDDGDGDDTPQQPTGSSEELEEVVPSELDEKCAKRRAILHANIAACYLKLGEHKHVVEACTEALRDDPNYVKALQRRAIANDALDTWSSLTSVQEDYVTLLKYLPLNSWERLDIEKKQKMLSPRVAAAQQNETAEMIDKLKGLGNSILGNFGMSTDNFQFVPNGQGGYSMNFAR